MIKQLTVLQNKNNKYLARLLLDDFVIKYIIINKEDISEFVKVNLQTKTLDLSDLKDYVIYDSIIEAANELLKEEK